MKFGVLACAVVLAAISPSAALADDPNDPAMRTAAARARDRAIIRQLNLEEAARVRARDAGYAAGWKAYSERQDEAAPRARAYERDRDRYDRQRAQYERDMAAWRRAVAACRAGDYAACDG